MTSDSHLFRDPDRVFHYRYRCENASRLTPIFRRYLSEPLAARLPLWLAPNCLTVFANVSAWIACAMLWWQAYFSREGNVNSVAVFFAAVGVLIYAVLDNADGIQATRTGATGPLGDFVDHWLDGVTSWLIPMSIFNLAGLDYHWQSAVVASIVLAYWTTNWERLQSQCMKLPFIGDVEANVAAIALLLLTAAFGIQIWRQTLFGITLDRILASLWILGAALAAASSLIKNKQRTSSLGIVSTIAVLWLWVSILSSSSNSTFVQAAAPFVVGLAGAKHVGDMQRANLIGCWYVTFDWINILLGTSLIAITLVEQYTPHHLLNATLVTALGVLCCKLANQFTSTSQFICASLELQLFSLCKVARNAVDAKAKEEPVVLKRCRPIHTVGLLVPASFVILAELVIWALKKWHFEHATYDLYAENWAGVLTSFLITLLLFASVNFGFNGSRKLRSLANLMLVVACLALVDAHIFLEHPLDFFFLGNNFQEIFYPQSVAMATHGLTFTRMLVWMNMVLLLLMLVTFTPLFSTFPRVAMSRAYFAAIACTLLVIVFSPYCRHHEMTYFIRTAADYLSRPLADIPSSDSFPYIKLPKDESNAGLIATVERPHIFLVVMESFNANFVEANGPNGQPYTPIFNSHIEKGLYVERFYGNSIQTARHYLPVHCSVPPSYWDKDTVGFPKLRLRSLEHILKEHGYRTLYFQSQQSLEFDNVGRFLKTIGFDEVHSMNGSFIGPGDGEKIWGWGLQDDLTFERVFDYLDRAVSKSNQPLFTTILTTSHHFPFTEMPPSQPKLYPSPENRAQIFGNSIHLADCYLATFFKELHSRPQYKDSLIILTGDHSFPAGEHGNYFNEHRAYEENFQIPLLMIWPNRIAPQRIKDVAFSQLDIAPTIAALLGITTPNHFRGREIQAGAAQVPIPMVQPYDSTRLCVVSYPYKYVKSIRSDDEYLYNLSADPQERNNLVVEYEASPILKGLREDIERLEANQHLLETNRIWPLNNGAIISSKQLSPEPDS